jgi:hypothetical protein
LWWDGTAVAVSVTMAGRDETNQLELIMTHPSTLPVMICEEYPMVERDEPNQELTQLPAKVSPVICEQDPTSIHQFASHLVEDAAARVQLIKLSDTSSPSGCLNKGKDVCLSFKHCATVATVERTSASLLEKMKPRVQSLKAKGILVNEPRFLKRSRNPYTGLITPVAKDYSTSYSNHIYLKAKKMKMATSSPLSNLAELPCEKFMRPADPKISPRNKLGGSNCMTPRSTELSISSSSSEDDFEGGFGADEFYSGAFLDSDSDDNKDTGHRNSSVNEEDFLNDLQQGINIALNSAGSDENQDGPVQMEVENQILPGPNNILCRALNTLLKKLNLKPLA